MMRWPLLLGCLVLSAGIVRAMARTGPLDLPDARKLHTTPVPRGGGLGIAAAFLLGMEVLSASGAIEVGYFRGVMLAAALLAGIGWWDDLRGLPFWGKLAAQTLGAGLVVASGLVWPLDGPGWWSGLLTLGWLVVVTNAVNFMDGLDGLVGGVALVAALFLWPGPSPFVTTIAVLLGPALLGFLIFNTPRARLFLGDVGSQFIGFTLAVLATFVGRDTGGGMATWLLPLILAPFLVDVAYTLVRRARAGERLTEAHRGHLYQILYRVGWPHPAVAFFHWGFAAVHGGAGILAMQRPESFWWLAGGLAGLHLLYFRLVHRLASTAGIGRW